MLAYVILLNSQNSVESELGIEEAATVFLCECDM